MKTCSTCSVEKSVDCFYLDGGRPASQCKSCIRQKAKAFYAVNKEHVLDRNRKWLADNYEKARLLWAKYRTENADKIEVALRVWRASNKERQSFLSKRWYEKNKEHHLNLCKEWGRSNPEKVRAAKEKWSAARRATPRGRLDHSMRTNINRFLKRGTKAGRATYKLLGFSAEDLRTHLEKQFRPGMSWDNFGEWHVDHRIPLSFFEFETPDCVGFKMAWNIKNLQPLWAIENLSKHQQLPPANQLQMHLRELQNG